MNKAHDEHNMLSGLFLAFIERPVPNSKKILKIS